MILWMGPRSERSSVKGRRAGAWTLALVAGFVAVGARPADAKGPELATVSGPGISGEVAFWELYGRDSPGAAPPLFFPLGGNQFPAGAEARGDGPDHTVGTPFVFTWYTTVYDGKPAPSIDRVRYYPGAATGPVVEVVTASVTYGGAKGWYRVDGATTGQLDDVVTRASAPDIVGAEHYEFAPGGADASSSTWVAVGADYTLPVSVEEFGDDANRMANGLSAVAVLATALAAGTGVVSALGWRSRRRVARPT